MKLFVDYGGTNFRYILDNEQEESYFELKSESINLVEILEKIVLGNPKIKEISISFAGHVKDGVIIAAPNINIKNFDIKKYFKDKHDIALYIENDLKSAALAEYEKIGKNSSLAVLYIGTGFGSAYIDDGNLIKGYSNLAGEIGHMPFKAAPFLCGCGKNNCLELFCSGSGLKKWTEYYKLECKPTLEDLKKCDNIHAQKILDNFYNALSHSVSTVVTLLNPEYLIMGGSVVLNNFSIINFIKNEVLKNAMPYAAKSVKMEVSNLKNGSLEGSRCLKKYQKK